MATRTKVSWSDYSCNPVTGCELASEGCGLTRWLLDRTGGCYAIHQARMRAFNPNKKIAAVYRGLVERNDDDRLDWTGIVKTHPERLAEPFSLPKKGNNLVFWVSMGDWLHEKVPDEFIARMFAVFALNPHLVFQTLTKRHARLRSLLNSGEFAEMAYKALFALLDELPGVRISPEAFDAAEKLLGSRELAIEPLPVLPNVWIGVSVENQKWAGIRIPKLLGIPAGWTKWLSCEPLLGPLDLESVCVPCRGCSNWRSPLDECCDPGQGRIDWVVVGGESGRGRSRPMHPDWPEEILDQCLRRKIPYHFKQWGDWSPFPSGWPGPTQDTKQRKERHVVLYDGRFCTSAEFHHDDHPNRSELASGMRRDVTSSGRPLRPYAVYDVGKKTAGRLLRGREWNEYPNTPDRRTHVA